MGGLDKLKQVYFLKEVDIHVLALKGTKYIIKYEQDVKVLWDPGFVKQRQRVQKRVCACVFVAPSCTGIQSHC